MDAELFLRNQAFIHATERLCSSERTKRCKSAKVPCKASFHISLTEQNGAVEQLLGPKAQDAVFIRLHQLQQGLISSVLGIELLQASGAPGSPQGPCFQYRDTTYAVKPMTVEKVVCSTGVYSSCTALTHQQRQGCWKPFIAAVPADMDCQGQEFVTLVTRHICLNLFAEQQSDGVEALASFAYQVQQQALHLSQHAPNSPAVDHPPPLNKSGAQSSGDICNSLSPPTEPAALSHWLTAAACEAKMLQMLLNQCDARDQQQQQHLLQAVAVHFGGRANFRMFSEV